MCKVTMSVSKLERGIYTRDVIYERKLLSKTVSGLPVPIVTITAVRSKGIEYRKR